MSGVRPVVVGVSGGSASGKSLLTRGLVEALGPERVLHIEHDRYYRPLPSDVVAADHNFDHPEALDTGLLVEHLGRLIVGEAVPLPRYSFSRHAREEGVDWVEARPVVLVEGLFVFSDAGLRDLFDHRVYVDAPADVRLGRRVVRDISERGREASDVVRQYLAQVRPAHETWIEPGREHAHVVLDGTDPPDRLVDQALRLFGGEGLADPGTRGQPAR